MIVRLGPAEPASPVVLAVPHAGRCYGPELLALARLPEAALAMLEDRWADRLTDTAVRGGATVLVARAARAWIDLNRDPRELDPAMADLPEPRGPLIESAKLRGGLGLIPRRVAQGGELWRRRLTAAEVTARLERLHEPWHQAIAAALAAAHARFGEAVLIDCHSMPPLTGEASARLVVGDRFGRSAGANVVAALLETGRRRGVRAARNAPYAGGYTLDRHGRPRAGLHAVQIELCRSLYLDPVTQCPSEDLASAQALVAALALAAGEAALSLPAIAAE